MLLLDHLALKALARVCQYVVDHEANVHCNICEGKDKVDYANGAPECTILARQAGELDQNVE